MAKNKSTNKKKKQKQNTEQQQQPKKPYCRPKERRRPQSLPVGVPTGAVSKVVHVEIPQEGKIGLLPNQALPL